jgi:glycosyltransferase involved in cell wall biosynthesis
MSDITTDCCWVTGSSQTGIAEQSTTVVDALHDRGVDITLVNSAPIDTGHSKPYVRDESGTVYPVNSLDETLLTLDPDLVIFHDAQVTVRSAASAIQPHAVTAARLGVNIREHLLAGNGYLNQVPALIEFMQSVDHIIASSPCVTRTLRTHGVGSERVTHIPTTLDMSDPHRTDPDPSLIETPVDQRGHDESTTKTETPEPTIGLIGRVNALKNQFPAIEGVTGLREMSPALTPNLRIAGDVNGIDQFPQALPSILPHFAPNFKMSMMGHVSDPDADFYPEIDIHAHPSWTENCPQTILEAARAGVPSVVSDLAWADAYPELDLLRCPPDDPLAWTEEFHRLLTDEDYWLEHAQKQQAAAVEHYDIATIIDDYIALFDQLLDDYAAFKFSAAARATI